MAGGPRGKSPRMVVCVYGGGAGEGTAGTGLAVASCGVALDGWDVGFAQELGGDGLGKRRQQLDHKRLQMLQSLNYILQAVGRHGRMLSREAA